MAKSFLDKVVNIFSNPFRMFFPEKMIGIDIATSSVKIVEISRWGGGKTLENYGQIHAGAVYKDNVFRNSQKGANLLSEVFISRVIRAILQEARIKTKAAVFSVPDFSTFCTSLELPPMGLAEIEEAVRYTAPQYIPLPITETTLDWKVISGKPGDKKSPLKVFLVAIPNQIIQEYQRVAQSAGLELYALEAEALAITRALIKDNKKIICLIDIGIQSTTINIVDKGLLKKSFSFSFSSGELARVVASTLNVDYEKAEEAKNQEGLMSKNPEIIKSLYLLIDPLIVEAKRVVSDFYQLEQKDIDEIYLSGGPANLPGLKEYFQETFKKPTQIPNCFSDLLYPPILEQTLIKMAPSFAVSVGVALGGLER